MRGHRALQLAQRSGDATALGKCSVDELHALAQEMQAGLAAVSRQLMTARLSEESQCPVCLENREKNTAFDCGHTACGFCAPRVLQGYDPRCPQCQRPVTRLQHVQVYA